MKALRIQQHGGPEVMEIVDLPVPEPDSKQVRVKVEAAGLNYSDIMIREGMYLEEMPLPYVMGREFCGTVDALGDHVNGIEPGTRVVGSIHGGAMAEYTLANAAALVPCPDELPPEQGAALLIQGITAVHCVDDVGRATQGQTVLIHAAAGGVGTLAVQIAKALGATVIGTASSDAKCRTITDLGASAVNYANDDWVDRVLELTDARGADLILESVGGEVFRRSFDEALATFGRMIVYGLSSGRLEKLHNRQILESNKAVIGYYLGAYFPRHMDRVIAATGKLMGYLQTGEVHPVIGNTFPLDKAIEAFDHMQSRQSIGKVVIVP